jgi:hypothetical protein
MIQAEKLIEIEKKAREYGFNFESINNYSCVMIKSNYLYIECYPGLFDTVSITDDRLEYMRVESVENLSDVIDEMTKFREIAKMLQEAITNEN